MKKVRLITDGACKGNPGPGGWAAILVYGPHRRELSGSEPETTNNRMELRAAIEGLRALKESCEVEVVTDSEYLKKGVTQWLPQWKSRGWVTASRKPVRNEDLWRELDRLSARHRTRWVWTRGHADDPENRRADELASRAADEMAYRMKMVKQNERN